MPIRSESDDTVHVLTIERPERRGALDLDHLEELDAAIATAAGAGARALVLTGSDGHFCAGADLTQLEDVSFTHRLAEVLDRLATLPVTTVAAISGSCMGLGMQLAISCDIRVADETARFAVPAAKLGLMVDAWTIDRLRRFWGEGATRSMLLTAAVHDIDDAWRLGFVQHRGDLASARELASGAARLAPLSQACAKLGLEVGDGAGSADFERAYERAWSSADLQEGRRAFAQRRAPEFEGA